MDKSWMSLAKTADGRMGQPYRDGVMSFLHYAMKVADQEGYIMCPCTKCVNVCRQLIRYVQIHLLQYGIMQSYTVWHRHGESRMLDEAQHHYEMNGSEFKDSGGIDALVEDQIRGDSTNTNQEEEVQSFDKLLNDSRRKVYPNCSGFTLLSFVIELFNLKVTNHMSNKAVDMWLHFLRKLLPEGNLVPKSTHEAKKILRDLGLSYELIDACINDCVLFWKENANLDKCPKCNVSRYKINGRRGKKIPHKILRYLPVTPRLKKLYMNKKIAKSMRWHKEKRVDDGESRHPADGEEWKEFDKQHPEFALEPRNVRLGIATDGFNPFGNMDNSYSIWPVVLVPYNLPPWLIMKELFLMLSLLIPGDKQPGVDIDVYLQPLVDELEDLWNNGVLTYDASSAESFQMRATMMWTIHDWPAFGDVSGWRTKGHYACYTCNDEPYFESVRSKTVYLNHRAYLPDDHPERRKQAAYNGKCETRKRSLELPVNKIEEQLNNVPKVSFGKDPNNKKRPRYDPNWTKVSILYDMPCCKKRKLLHNIDAMHVLKNISEAICGTMLGIEGKNKDTNKARNDMEDMNIRKELWLIQRPDGSYVKPRANFSLTSQQKEGFLEFLKSVKYPDGYAANISRSVNVRNGRLTGLKSHDYHVLIQRILPIGMRGFVDKEISITLFELGSFFQDLCSRKLKHCELEKLEERIVHILCKLEKIFPPAFFDVMVHLAVHLPREAIRGGPVQFRWMYPIERFLGKLKRFVSNRARPEGSIVQAYIVKECINFCSMYLDGAETIHNRPDRNDDLGVRGNGLTVFNQTTRPIGLITRDGQMSQELRNIAHWFLLYNSPELGNYLEEHKNVLAIREGENINHKQQKEFPKWFKDHINRLRVEGSPEATDELWSLANGPNLLVKEYSGCIINGVRFHTRELDDRRTSQNSGVLVRGDHEHEMHDFYGHISKVWELEYRCHNKIVLFQCEWYNTGNTGRTRTIRTDAYCTSINVTSRWYQSDPFVLPRQVKQVFYLNDTKWGKPWQVVQQVQHRGVFDVPELDNEEFGCPIDGDDAFQQESITSVVPIDVEAEVHCHRDGVENEVMLGVELSNETIEDNGDDEEDEGVEIPDVDMDPDMDYDM